MTTQEMEKRFRHHSPTDDQIERYESIRFKAKVLAAYINEFCPESRERSLSFTKIEEAVMWANASIAINE